MFFVVSEIGLLNADGFSILCLVCWCAVLYCFVNESDSIFREFNVGYDVFKEPSKEGWSVEPGGSSGPCFVS